jgi:hypothetical protein
MSEADALVRRLVANWIESHPSYWSAEQAEGERHLRGPSERRMAAGEHEPQPVAGYGAFLDVLAGTCTIAASACLCARAGSRRSWSMARLRAVVIIQPAGLGGAPSPGQRCSPSFRC